MPDQPIVAGDGYTIDQEYVLTNVFGTVLFALASETNVGSTPPPTCFLVDFPLTGPYLAADGTPVANGLLSVRLSWDCNCPCADYQINARNRTTIRLDENGEAVENPQIRPNAQLKPAGSYYILEAYSAAGQLVLNPKIFYVTG